MPTELPKQFIDKNFVGIGINQIVELARQKRLDQGLPLTTRKRYDDLDYFEDYLRVALSHYENGIIKRGELPFGNSAYKNVNCFQ